MAGVTLPYRLNNRLAVEIEKERARQIFTFERRVSIGEVENQLSEYCGTGVQNIKKIKSGHIRPSILTALKMAQYFNCKVEELFFLEGDKNNVEKDM
jgi:DNA-binding XRE family transcriptional regulator